ncbi:PAS domain-containing protein, partial [Acinetobacter baumannii]
SEQRFQAFMDHVPAIAWLRDADERYLFVNREYERLQRVTAADRLGKHPSEVFPPEVAARLLANDKLAEAGPVRTEERVPDGEGVMRS